MTAFIKTRSIFLYLGVFLFFMVYYVALFSVCNRFYFVQGYDRCEIPPYFVVLFFFGLAASIGLLLPIRQSASSVVIWTVYLMNVFGSVALYPYFINQISFSGLIYVIMVVVSFVVSARIISYFHLNFKYVVFSTTSLYIMLTVFTLFLLFIFVSTFGLRFQYASIFDVYDVRDNFKDVLRESGGRITSYATLLIGFLFSPLLFLVGSLALRTNLLLGILMIVVGLFAGSQIYASAAFKSVAAISALSILFSLTIRKSKVPFQRFLFSIFGLISLMLILQITNLNTSAIDHWFRRAFISPGMNTIFYFEEFGWFTIGNSASAPLTISLDYYGSAGSANSGLYGNGFARGGLLGILFNLSLLIVFCIFLDGVARFTPSLSCFPMAVVIGDAFSNSAATTVMVSYGGVLLLVLLYLLSGSLRREHRRIHGYG